MSCGAMVVESGAFHVEDVETRRSGAIRSRRSPPPRCKQEAARKLGFAAPHHARRAVALRSRRDHLHAYRWRADGPFGHFRRARRDHRSLFGPLPRLKSRAITKPLASRTRSGSTSFIRPTEFTRDRFGSGDEARLYELVWKRAPEAKDGLYFALERTITLRDGTGQHELRATGQVVKFPGFLAVYEEGRDHKADAPGADEEG